MKTYAFPLLNVTKAGFKHLLSDRAFLQSMMLVPILVGFAVILLIDGLDLVQKPLLVAALKVPDDFVRGVFLAMFVRHMLLKEDVLKNAMTPPSQLPILHSAIIFTALNFVISGIMAGVSQIVLSTQAKEATSIPLEYSVLSLVGMGAIIWLFRLQWLPIVAAAGMPVITFFKDMQGGFLLSFRIFLLWFLISIPSFFIMGLATEIVAISHGSATLQDLSGPGLWILLLLSVILALLTCVVQTAASIYAIKFCMTGKQDNV